MRAEQQQQARQQQQQQQQQRHHHPKQQHQQRHAASDGASPAPGSGAAGAAQQPLPVLDSVLEYEKLHRIGEGTYGVVYKARHIETGQIVALKKVRFNGSREGLPVTSVRELAVLQAAEHPHIVKLLRVVTGTRPDSVFLVFEFCEHDLGRVLDSHGPGIAAAPVLGGAPGGAEGRHHHHHHHGTSAAAAFSEAEVKTLFRQLLSAVAWLHGQWVLHRDLKLSNLLYTNTGCLKLCDFGLARHFDPCQGRLTPRVVTLWYRAPELLLGCERYGPAIDCWALGCILGELLKGSPLFPAEGELECLQMHAALLGSPSPRIWPSMRSLPLASGVRWPEQPYNYLRRSFPELSAAGLSLLNGLLTYDPARRLSAEAALNHEYFKERPFPRRAEHMPTFSSASPQPQYLAPPAGAGAGAHPPVKRTSAAAFGSSAPDAQQRRDRRFGAAFGGGGGPQRPGHAVQPGLRLG